MRPLLAAVTLLAAAPAAVAGWRDLQRSEPPTLRQASVVAVPHQDPPAVAPVVGETVVEEPATVSLPEVRPVAAESAGGSSAPCDDCDQEIVDCREAFEKLRSDTVVKMDRQKLDIRLDGDNNLLVDGQNCPFECPLQGKTVEMFVPRRFATTTFTWKAAGYCHKPLYFEHWNLERYGHSHGFAADTVLSAAHFFARIPALPYQMGVELPWECVYPLGYYRPGSCAPWTVPAVPVSARGFAVGAAAATGIVFLLP